MTAVACPSADTLQAFVDGQATAEERAAVARHAQGCPGCRAILALAPPSGSGPVAAAPLEVLAHGTKVGRFVVDRVIGMGGMGVVYAALDPELDRRVALKLLREESEGRRERLAREAQALARVADPNVCAVYDIGTHDGRLFIAMELVDGQTLGQWWREARRDWRQVASVFAGAARGLAAAHGAGVIHRDFKPDNVLVGADGRVRVTDFGLAAWLPMVDPPPSPAVEGHLTQSGTVMGTPLYMAPEQHAGNPTDERSDQWSFAAVLYEALHGSLPFDGRSEVDLAEAKAAGRIRPPPPGSRVPGWLDDLVRRGLAPHPEDRWPSMVAVAKALEHGRPRRRLAWAAAALAVAAVASSSALLSRHTDSGAEAGRLAALAERMEAELRIEHMAPPHDLRPALAKVRSEVEKLRTEAARDGGPASFALGKGLELLGDDDGARAAYERARADGFRIPRVAEGLGTVLSNIYQREYERARASLAGQALDRRLAVLQAELSAPASQLLASAGDEPWRAAMHRAHIALLSRDFAGARAAAGEALAADPGRYEALAFQALAWRTQTIYTAPDDTQKIEPLARALEAAEAAARYARSDPHVAILVISIHWSLERVHNEIGDKTTEMPALVAALDQAAILDPDSPELLVNRSGTLRLQAQAAKKAGTKAFRPLTEEAIRVARRAVEIDGGEIASLDELTTGLVSLARYLALTGAADAALPPIEEGLRVVDKEIAREPEAPIPHVSAQKLHDARAEAMSSLHRKGEYFAEMRRAAASGRQAIQLGYYDAAAAEIWTGLELVHLADDAWQSGRDPRPEALDGLLLVRAGRIQYPHSQWAADTLIVTLGNVAEGGLRVGDDPKALLADARTLTEDFLSRNPDHVFFQMYEGWLALLGARGSVLAGQDPTVLLAEAEHWLGMSVPKIDQDQTRHLLVEVPLVGAHWQALRGIDPMALLSEAQARLDDGIRRTPGWGNDLVADLALDRALWARRSGLRAEEDARRGLAALEKVIADEPRDASTWVEKAELEALDGDTAAATASLDRASALNGLVRGSGQWKEARALVTR